MKKQKKIEKAALKLFRLLYGENVQCDGLLTTRIIDIANKGNIRATIEADIYTPEVVIDEKSDIFDDLLSLEKSTVEYYYKWEIQTQDEIITSEWTTADLSTSGWRRLDSEKRIWEAK